jgi:hypothetical protein
MQGPTLAVWHPTDAETQASNLTKVSSETGKSRVLQHYEEKLRQEEQ